MVQHYPGETLMHAESSPIPDTVNHRDQSDKTVDLVSPEQQVNFVTRMVKHFCPGNDTDFQDHFPHRTTMSAFDLLSYCSVGN